MDVETFDHPSLISLSPSRNFLESNTPKATITSASRDYIIHLASLATSYVAAFSANSNSLNFVDKEQLRFISNVQAHADSITSIRAHSNFNTAAGSSTGKRLLLSSSRDGLVKAWDDRSQGPCILQFDHKRAILSFDVSPDGNTIAAGTELKGDEAHIVFWDVRKTSEPTHTNTSAHSDDITTLQFHPRTPNLLLSASTDGLLCTIDAREPDEDESGLQVGNWGCSISNAGWTDCGDFTGSGVPLASSRIWAHSDMQTVSLWNDELDILHDYGDVRKPNIPGRWQTEYFIDATWIGSGSKLTSSAGGLGIWAGTNSGDVALLLAEDAEQWRLEHVFTGWQKDIVRSVLWDAENSVVILGGEDSRMSAWSVSDGSGGPGTSDSMEVDEAIPPRGYKRSRAVDSEHVIEPKEKSRRMDSVSK